MTLRQFLAFAVGTLIGGGVALGLGALVLFLALRYVAVAP